MRIAVVVQRYGAEINGGAELHARYVAEHLARHAEVEVLTTCARDYVTWENELRAGVESINGVPVRRFPVAHPRTPELLRAAFSHGVRSAALAAGRAGMARQRRADEPCPAALHRGQRRHVRLVPLLQLPLSPCVPWPARGGEEGRPGADGRARRHGWTGDVPADFPRGAGADVQLVRGARDAAARRRRAPAGGDRGHRIGAARAPAARAIPPAVRRAGSVRHLRRAHRREQGLQGAVRVLPATHPERARPNAAAAHRQLDPAGARSPDDPPPRVRERRRQVRRDGRRRCADHAVVLREPLDGRARGVGPRHAGARQRPLRRAEGTVPAQQRRPLLRELSRSFRRRWAHSPRARRFGARWAATAWPISAVTTRGR